MPLFLIERNFAEQLEVNRDDVLQVTQVNAYVGIQWLFSFLSADKKKTYCLYEAPNAEAIREAALRLNIPAGTVASPLRLNAAFPSTWRAFPAVFWASTPGPKRS